MSDKYPVMSSYKAIQTSYRGYMMRSRLEARWAVFLDTLGITYQYEPEGFDLDGMRYLPDFFLPKFDCWMEIKPDIPTPDEREKAIRLALATTKPVLLFAGSVWHDVKGYNFIPVPDTLEEKQFARSHAPEAVWLSTEEFIASNEDGSLWGIDFARGIGWGGFAHWTECKGCGSIGLMSFALCPDTPDCQCPDWTFESPRLLEAYTSARSARFEFGEKGGRT